VASPPEPASIYDWAVPSNLQPEPITLEVWRNLLWEIPATTIRSPDAALFDCAPNDRRPLPASLVRIQVDWARLAHLVRG
jgi:hypothetical protein